MTDRINIVADHKTIDKTLDSSVPAYKDSLISVSHGSIDLGFGSFNGASIQTLTNDGLITAGPGGTLSIGAASIDHQATGTIDNHGLILANSGTISLSAPVVQSGLGQIDIVNNGTVSMGDLESAIYGGTIGIGSGTLSMAYYPPYYPGVNVTASLNLFGPSATLDFRNTSSISEVFNAAGKDLAVFDLSRGPAVQIADFHLTGPTHYTANDFTVQGNAVLFAHHS